MSTKTNNNGTPDQMDCWSCDEYGRKPNQVPVSKIIDDSQYCDECKGTKSRDDLGTVAYSKTHPPFRKGSDTEAVTKMKEVLTECCNARINYLDPCGECPACEDDPRKCTLSTDGVCAGCGA